MKVKAAAFDWNGTLINDAEWIFEGVKAIFRYFGKPEPTLDEYREEIAQDFMKFYERRGIVNTWELLNKIMKEKLATLSPPELFPDTVHVLEFLRKRGVPVGLISFREERALKNDLAYYGITHLFDLVRGSAREKDIALRDFMGLCGVTPAEMVYITDTVGDIKTAKSIGVQTIGVAHGYDSQDALRRARPDVLIADLSELLHILEA